MPTKKASVLIKKSSLIIDKKMNQYLLPYHLSHSQFRILMILYKSKTNSLRQIDIERLLSMTNPTVTGLIKNLEKNNYIKKIKNPNDKRSHLLILSDHAMDIKDELISLADRIEKEMTNPLSHDEINHLCHLLNKMMKE